MQGCGSPETAWKRKETNGHQEGNLLSSYWKILIKITGKERLRKMAERKTYGWETGVRKVVPYVPGEQPKRKDIIKLNTNECPYPTSPEIQKLAAEFEIEQLDDYFIRARKHKADHTEG